MKYYGIHKPCGMTELCAEVENVCNNAERYKKCGMKPPHMLIQLDKGEGRTTFLEYMTDMYKKHGIISFTGGMDDYIEITFDGTAKQMNTALEEIDSAAVYDNSYKGIVGMDISGFAHHINETQFVDFLSACKRICKDATVVFFVRSVPSAAEERLIKSIGGVKKFKVEKYTPEEISEIVFRILSYRGVCIKEEEAFNATMKKLIKGIEISNIESALAFADLLIQYVSFSSFTPEIDVSILNTVQNDITNSKGAMTNEQK